MSDVPPGLIERLEKQMRREKVMKMSNEEKISSIREVLYASDICNAEKFERIEEIVFDKEEKVSN